MIKREHVDHPARVENAQREHEHVPVLTTKRKWLIEKVRKEIEVYI